MKTHKMIAIAGISLALSGQAIAADRATMPLSATDSTTTGNYFLYFSLSKLEVSLAEQTQVIYDYKAEVLSKCAQAIGELPKIQNWRLERDPATEARLFALNALAPFFGDIHSSYFETRVMPHYQRAKNQYNDRFGIKSLADFKQTEEVKQVGLKMLQAAWMGLKPFLLSVTDLEDFQKVNASLGKAIAVNDPKLFNRDLAEPMLARFSTQLRTQGIAAMASSLSLYFAE